MSLWEASARLGGRLVSAAQCDAPVDRYLGWLLREVDRSNTVVEVGVAVTSERVARGGFDEIIVATGASWVAPDLPGAELPFVATVGALASWLASDDDTVGTRVVVVGGGKVGLSLADVAARRGRDVTVVESSTVFASELGLPGRFQLVADLEERGVHLQPACAVLSFEPGCVVGSGAEGTTRIPADTVIIATPREPDRGLRTDLEAANIAFREIGDCRRFGLLEGALLDAAGVEASM